MYILNRDKTIDVNLFVVVYTGLPTKYQTSETTELYQSIFLHSWISEIVNLFFLLNFAKCRKEISPSSRF